MQRNESDMQNGSICVAQIVFVCPGLSLTNMNLSSEDLCRVGLCNRFRVLIIGRRNA